MSFFIHGYIISHRQRTVLPIALKNVSFFRSDQVLSPLKKPLLFEVGEEQGLMGVKTEIFGISSFLTMLIGVFFRFGRGLAVVT